ncbi:ComEA family DNA-binding protein [bacterium]|nr:ComEA family DNA-binding protein [bacterium]
MFRGITRNEHFVGFAAIALIFAGIIYHQVRVDQDRRIEISGSPQEISPTAWRELAVEEPTESQGIDDSVIEGQIDINRASAEVLQALPGIGPTRAEAIVADREQNGPFGTVNDLGRVSGIGEKTLESLRPMILASNVEPPPTPRREIAYSPTPTAPRYTPVPTPVPTETPLPIIHVNRATVAELQTLEGIGEKRAQDILVDRTANGPYRHPEDLMRVSGIGPKTIEKNRYRLVFD